MSAGLQGSSHAAIQVWWDTIDSQLGLFLSVVASGQEIPDSDVEAALQYMTVRLPQIKALDPPAPVTDAHHELVSALENMKQSLVYRIEKNDLTAQTRYDIARVNIDSLRFQLLRFNIIL